MIAKELLLSQTCLTIVCFHFLSKMIFPCLEYLLTEEQNIVVQGNITSMNSTWHWKTLIILKQKPNRLKPMASVKDCIEPCRRNFMLPPLEKKSIAL